LKKALPAADALRGTSPLTAALEPSALRAASTPASQADCSRAWAR
jgi:hypothetical protein